MNRTDRLTAMIIYLQGHQRVTVQKMAERYDISERTVYRDLQALQEAGVPMGSEAGKCCLIRNGYHFLPVMYDKNEDCAPLEGEQVMEQSEDTKFSRSYSAALDRIHSVLRRREKEYI